jgi:hypothetical protein
MPAVLQAVCHGLSHWRSGVFDRIASGKTSRIRAPRLDRGTVRERERISIAINFGLANV